MLFRVQRSTTAPRSVSPKPAPAPVSAATDSDKPQPSTDLLQKPCPCQTLINPAFANSLRSQTLRSASRLAALHPTSTAPPFTLNTSPETNPAHGVHRNTIGPAISSGSAARPSGINPSAFLDASGSAQRSSRHLRPHPPRRHAVAQNPLRPQLARQALRQRNQRALARRIVRMKRLAPLRRRTRHQNNMPSHRTCPSPASSCFNICADPACTSPNTLSRFTPIVPRHCAAVIVAIG